MRNVGILKSLLVKTKPSLKHKNSLTVFMQTLNVDKIIRIELSVKHWLKPIRKKLDTLLKVEVTFEWYEGAMIFHVAIFIFCLETKVRENITIAPYNCRYCGHGSTQVLNLHQDVWLIIVCFSFSQRIQIFKFNLVLIEQFSPQLIYIFIFQYSVYLQVHPVRLRFFSWKPVKFWWGSMLFLVKVYSHKMLLYFYFS